MGGQSGARISWLLRAAKALPHAIFNCEGALFAGSQKPAGWASVVYSAHNAVCHDNGHGAKTATGDTYT
jgi:hypothetical protein